MLWIILLLPHFTTSKGRAWREYLRRREWYKSLHICMPNICMETCSGYEPVGFTAFKAAKSLPPQWHLGIGVGVPGDMWEESRGFSTELSVAWDLVACYTSWSVAPPSALSCGWGGKASCWTSDLHNTSSNSLDNLTAVGVFPDKTEIRMK